MENLAAHSLCTSKDINKDIKRHILDTEAPENSSHVKQKQPKVPPNRESNAESSNVADREDPKDVGKQQEE